MPHPHRKIPAHIRVISDRSGHISRLEVMFLPKDPAACGRLIFDLSNALGSSNAAATEDLGLPGNGVAVTFYAAPTIVHPLLRSDVQDGGWAEIAPGLNLPPHNVESMTFGRSGDARSNPAKSSLVLDIEKDALIYYDKWSANYYVLDRGIFVVCEGFAMPGGKVKLTQKLFKVDPNSRYETKAAKEAIAALKKMDAERQAKRAKEKK